MTRVFLKKFRYALNVGGLLLFRLNCWLASKELILTLKGWSGYKT